MQWMLDVGGITVWTGCYSVSHPQTDRQRDRQTDGQTDRETDNGAAWGPSWVEVHRALVTVLQIVYVSSSNKKHTGTKQIDTQKDSGRKSACFVS